MFPILLHIEPITIYSLWIFLAFGFFMSLLIINKLSRFRRVKMHFIASNSLYIFLSGLIFSRLIFILQNFQYFILDFNFGRLLEFFYIWDKGLNPWGALLGIFLATYWLAKRENANFSAWADILSVSTLGVMIFGNIGAFLDGRNYGTPTEFPWGVLVDSSRFAVPIHPVQIYAAIYCSIILFFLISIFNTNEIKDRGNVALIGAFVYSFFRFLEGFLRGDEAFFQLWILRDMQIVALIGMLLTGFYLFRRYRAYSLSNESS